MADTSLIKPIQPYFVFMSSRFYQEIYLKQGISHFYSFTGSDVPHPVTAVPDGCVDIIFEYGAGAMQAYVYGTVLASGTAFVCQNKEYFGVRFMPGVQPSVVGVPVRELTGQTADLRGFKEARPLIVAMEHALSFEERIRTFLAQYVYVYAGHDAAPDLAESMRRLIYGSGGRIKVSELEQRTGYTSRYMNKVFTHAMGMSAKTFCKIIRFQRTLECLNHMPEERLVDVAADFGYYDQSQLVHDFRSFCSLTPRAYRMMVVENAYTDKVVETSYL